MRALLNIEGSLLHLREGSFKPREGPLRPKEGPLGLREDPLRDREGLSDPIIEDPLRPRECPPRDLGGHTDLERVLPYSIDDSLRSKEDPLRLKRPSQT